MADTREDISVGSSDWTDVYTVTGISEKKDMQICNKGTGYILYQEGSTKPLAEDINGQIIGILSKGTHLNTVTGVKNKVWLKALSINDMPVNVQEI